jgi:5,10-methylenetetrahydromethanopterin reductase
MALSISCAFPPGPDATDHVVLAESLGYERAWLYDSPALYEDVWVHLCRAAERTHRIGLGPAVLVPNLRHPLVTASAIATLARLAPDRTVVAIGTGFTGRMAMGQKALPWSFVRGYVEQLRALLAGDRVEIDGAVAQMIHPDGFTVARPIDVPIVVAANGPKGTAIAHELGDGVMTVAGAGQSDFDWCATLTLGTVLDDGEDAGSERARAAAGPAMTVAYHGIYEGHPEAVDGLPGGAEWRKAIEAFPPETRHLAVHADHLVRVTERDRPLLTSPDGGDLLRAFTWTGTAAEVRARAEAAAAAGVTELLYAPMGPDIDRELRAFVSAVGPVQDSSA